MVMQKNTQKRKVCILRSNPVNPDSRVEKEAWTLTKAGYDVHILAWDRESCASECQEFVKVADALIPITRLGHPAIRKISMFWLLPTERNTVCWFPT